MILNELQSVKKPINYNLVAILSISAILVAGIWIFGFDDELFGTKQITHDSVSQPIQQPLPNPPSPTTTENRPAESLQTKPIETKSEPQPVVTKTTDEPKPIGEQTTSKEELNPISLLQTKEFALDAEGTAWEGAPSTSKAADIELKLIPIEGTKLEKFDVSDGKIVIGITGISFDKGTAEIKGTTITISSVNDDSLDPFFTITGTLDEPILADKDNAQKVTFSNQLIFFGKKDESTPHHFNASGELKHSSV